MDQVIDWLNENETRAFPLLDDANKLFSINGANWLLPENFILDLQLVLKTGSLVDEQNDVLPVVMSKIELLQSGDVKVIFSVGINIITEFIISSPQTQQFPLYIRNTDGNLAVFGEGILSFKNSVTLPLSLTTNIPVEPATCAEFNGPWLGVNSLRVSPEKVSASEMLYGIDRIYEPVLPIQDNPTTTAIAGDISFLEGYNFRVAINDGLIDLEIGSGYGLLMNCATSFIPEEYLDCDDIVSYINGIPPDSSGNFRLTAGSNINITKGAAISTDFYDAASQLSHEEIANSHTLFVGLNFQATDICAPINIVPQI